MGGPEGGPAAVKGILKPSTMRAETLSASGDGDADARRDAKGKAPLLHSRSSGEDVRTHTFHRFHDRVADVFASLGPGLTRGGALASGSGAPAPPPAWMPANTSVVRRGRDVRDGSDEDSDDDDEANRAGADDDDVARRRDESRGAYPDDLDCLASDDDDDETRRGVTLGRSVGRCAALDAEDEYDYYDDVAAASDGSDALKRKIGLVSQSAGTAGSGGAGPRREARETYVPPAKRARADAGATARSVAWDGDVREVRREPRGNAAAGARTSDLPSRRRTNSWVPDHVRNPHKYDVYALDEPLIIGGGSRDDAAEFFFASGVVAKPGGSASAGGKPGGKLNARRTEVGGSSPPSGGDARHPDGDTEDDARKTPMPAPTFSASSTATAAAREAARRRRDERRVAVVAVVANGEVPGSKAARNERLVSFDAAADDEAEDGRGSGAVAPVAGFERGSAKRFRSSRKRGTRGEDAR
jgi:hypothetical protein